MLFWIIPMAKLSIGHRLSRQRENARATIRCVWLDAESEDCTINVLLRMWQNYGRLFMDAEEMKSVASDPSLFPPAVLFARNKEFEPPKVDEGFESVETYQISKTTFACRFLL